MDPIKISQKNTNPVIRHHMSSESYKSLSFSTLTNEYFQCKKLIVNKMRFVLIFLMVK